MGRLGRLIVRTPHLRSHDRRSHLSRSVWCLFQTAAIGGGAVSPGDPRAPDGRRLGAGRPLRDSALPCLATHGPPCLLSMREEHVDAHHGTAETEDGPDLEESRSMEDVEGCVGMMAAVRTYPAGGYSTTSAECDWALPEVGEGQGWL